MQNTLLRERTCLNVNFILFEWDTKKVGWRELEPALEKKKPNTFQFVFLQRNVSSYKRDNGVISNY